MDQSKIGFIGAGNMAEAIIRGIIQKGILSPSQILISDLSESRRNLMKNELKVQLASEPGKLFEKCSTIIFAVKPQSMPAVMEELQPFSHADHCYISICAGIRCSAIERGMMGPDAPSPRVIRVMPNTPALLGMGMSGLCKGLHAHDDDLERAAVLFDAVGKTLIIDETQMDALTAITGSGPAYLFAMIEALIEAAKNHGFSGEEAEEMVLQMVRGAAELAATSRQSPAELRKAVTSPGGTTAAGLAALQEHGFSEAIAKCVDAAEKRGKELGGD